MIESAARHDLPQLHALLERLHLRLACVDERLPTMLVAREAGQTIGTATLATFGLLSVICGVPAADLMPFRLPSPHTSPRRTGHGINIVRESGCHRRSRADRYLRRNSSS